MDAHETAHRCSLLRLHRSINGMHVGSTLQVKRVPLYWDLRLALWRLKRQQDVMSAAEVSPDADPPRISDAGPGRVGKRKFDDAILGSPAYVSLEMGGTHAARQLLRAMQLSPVICLGLHTKASTPV